MHSEFLIWKYLNKLFGNRKKQLSISINYLPIYNKLPRYYFRKLEYLLIFYISKYIFYLAFYCMPFLSTSKLQLPFTQWFLRISWKSSCFILQCMTSLFFIDHWSFTPVTISNRSWMTKVHMWLLIKICNLNWKFPRNSNPF